MKKFLFFILLAATLRSYSQQGNLVFNDTVVHSLVIETDLVDWFGVLEQDYQQNVADPVKYPQVYRKCNIIWDGLALNNCGFREKGNASNFFTHFGKKKPLKISFDEFLNQNMDGLKKINLNNFTNDPSLLHDAVANKLFRDEGITACRTSYAKLWVNGEYIGLYLVIENVDKTFLKFHFGGSKNDGNLYKTGRNANFYFDWKGGERTAYEDEGLNLQTNDTINDWSKLIALIDLLNNDHSAGFKQKLESMFDVHTFLKALAIEKCIRSWDSYWGNGNNFYLYEHPDGKIRWIPWDMNETFQDIKVLSGTSFFDGYLIPTPQFDKRPLLQRIFEFDDWNKEYLDNACNLIQQKFTMNNLGKYMLDRHNLVDSAYQADPHKYNSYSSFQNSLTDDNLDEVSIAQSAFVLRINYPGLFPFIRSQREWAADQMHAWDHDCDIKDNGQYILNIYPNPAVTYVNIANDQADFDYARFRLYDFTGRVCRETGYELMIGSYFTFKLDDLPAGIYLLIKQSSGGRIGKARVIVR